MFEDECPCPQEPCGLVDLDKASPDCDQHTGWHTMRQVHSQDECNALAILELGAEMEGGQLSVEALDRARRVLYGKTTPEEARQELEEKWMQK